MMRTIPSLYGFRYSVYTRVARFACAEKGVAYRYEEVDPFDPDLPPSYLEIHPFRRVPVLDHDGVRIYETAAITQYVDEAFEGPSLQPAGPIDRARMRQVIAVVDAYGYWPLVRQVFSHRVLRPRAGRAPDEAEIAQGMAAARRLLEALERLVRERGGADDAIDLADVHLAPMVGYFSLAPEGAELLAQHPALADWWEQVRARRTFVETDPGLPAAG